MDDIELVREYAAGKSENAFTTLVESGGFVSRPGHARHRGSVQIPAETMTAG